MFITEFVAAHPWMTAIIGIAVVVVARSIRVANQYERGVVFRLGKFNRTAGPGIYLVWAPIEWQIKLDLRTGSANHASIYRTGHPARQGLAASYSKSEILAKKGECGRSKNQLVACYLLLMSP
jgi:regulator of protease activity HflC (stomatin/prohibitin superfamily)